MDMVPKSSNGDARPGSSSEPQPMESMETSTGVASSVLGKREDPGENEGDRESVDDDEVKDDDDEDEDEDEEEDDGHLHWDKDTHWDNDSYDGVEYKDSDYDWDFMGDTDLETRYRFYYRTVIKTKGFFENTDGFPGGMIGGISRVKDLDYVIEEGYTVRHFLINLATQCVEKYNETKKKNLILHDFLWANFRPGAFTKYNITFLARETDSPDAPLVRYQAKAGEYCGKETYLILCRPSPVELIDESG